jgi:hypothetical protein
MIKKNKKPVKNSQEEDIKPEQIKYENKQLKILFFTIGGILLAFLIGYFFISSLENFEYRGINIEIVKEIAPYKISIPFIYQGKEVPYDFYLRKNPKKIGNDIDFNGELDLMKNIVFNSEENFNCDGDGLIAIANLASLLDKIGAKVIKDENATCDSQGRYTYILLKKSNITDIKQTGISCYDININDCEILKATERFMIEIFAKINE